ncbi:MAG: hypothetical protein UY31_C0013G0013 [Candidatus Wolfebacteria bacterium GW2011_GWE1_48_7]|uniref:Type 4 fimbrial biogenesis protein PilX N-terminal domain-containing protein n=2 Tax=Candidatus Wolfeibacteriota TaxID=1752735 RepID=A0A0G1U8K9_9BACT|nr:MAG: hypothetical protein UX70_C0001G0482 [Candidatus Wolfebacteria bacterium GW2011_GWB1_47_1]KKU37158.1 MAG: hypothetical protein UX49_C0001G0028 [Candidatus Wolfebacteria bacterium GW2011_GWC2_46_275]KKU42682.1 MAG: hypothetical protein UX58_C0001G0114 [Candidatus Wolfebacteria bacterium GW2011_GWB2_46_69]KKU54583.1 MAG: hypothetical protein UX76_C0001G0042 [Candidatus Wolfebacteria bacterium GW2011_GWC1_47_103]KKU59967.1 MAG: hypothetical protein UX83_C0001G0042 [Candidatus Wolfebacteria
MKKTIFPHNPYRTGQSMILTVLVLSSAVLALSAIGGYMMLIRLRINSDIVNTTKAIYIADAGLECEAYNQFQLADIDCNDIPYNAFPHTSGVVDPRASYVSEYTAGPPSYMLSKGSYRSASRSFRLGF